MKDKIFLVRYCGGSYEDYYDNVIFATTRKSKAQKYTRKFNNILKKWKQYYEQFETDRLGIKWLDNEHTDKYERWHSLRNITKCYVEEIKVRD